MTARDRGPERAKATKTGRELERRVADAYRAMGARKVEHDVELAGHQIDVYVELETLHRSLHRVAVEVKDYSSPVGIRIVSDFSDIVDRLRRERLVDEGVVVSAAGFSRPARNAAKKHDIRLLESADLDAMVTEMQAPSSPPTIPTAPPAPRPGEGEEEDKRPSPAEVVTPDEYDYDAFVAPVLSSTSQPKEGSTQVEEESEVTSPETVRERLIKILRDPFWQGIVAVLALVVAIGTWFWPDIRVLLLTARTTATPTMTATPLRSLTPMPGDQVVVEIDGLVIDASDDRCQEIVCNSSPRIQVTVLDSEGVPLQPGDFSYNWRFDPPDSNNRDMLDSRNYATIYSVPCDRDNQTVTVEVLKGGKTLAVRTICFDIKRQP